ncbi:Molybdenum cofactor biosynthesis protein MoaD [uncultured Candidatus Thioglobus sp.]|nr:Molybdenum cofactor biosynthesis protein MoaD [uncultured Candidatus Thioglobus sp.]SMM98887.1 Molybdenum cofactor biosynthesis protein MoaD [uncultured Candidatus Thioglobus sp.]
MKVLYFASLKESLNLTKELIQISTPITVSRLRQILVEKHGEYLFKDSSLCAVNQTMATDEQLINNTDEVAFFPAVTGG